MRNVLFTNIKSGEACYDVTNKATYKGITVKTIILLAITIAVSILIAVALPVILTNNPEAFLGVLFGSSIVGFITVIIGRISDRAAKYCGVIYSVCEGIFLGSITAIFEAEYPGIAIVAVFSTLIIFAVMLLLFATGVIKGGNAFRAIVMGVGIGCLALALFTVIMGIFVPAIVNNLGFCILFEAFFLIYGAITLTFNFMEARAVVDSGCDKSSEWSVSLGLEVTLLYIYIEVLRLLFYIFMSNRD